MRNTICAEKLDDLLQSGAKFWLCTNRLSVFYGTPPENVLRSVHFSHPFGLSCECGETFLFVYFNPIKNCLRKYYVVWLGAKEGDFACSPVLFVLY